MCIEKKEFGGVAFECASIYIIGRTLRVVSVANLDGFAYKSSVVVPTELNDLMT